MLDNLLTTVQAAERIDTSVRMIQRAVQRGLIPPARTVGRVILLHPADVDAYLLNRRPQGWPKGKPRKKRKRA